MNHKTMTRLLLFFIGGIAISCSTDSNLFLNESFDQNNLGWIEETTDSHDLEIRDGKYMIHCKDTSAFQSSTSPMNSSFLIGLPDTYEISTLAKFIEGKKSDEFGLILVSASVEYRFGLFSEGKSEVITYDRNSEKETRICAKDKGDLKFDSREQVKVKIVVSDKTFKFYIQDKLTCEGLFQTKQWVDLRLFSSSTTKVEFDDLIIKGLG